MVAPSRLFEILVVLILRRNGFFSFSPQHYIGGRSNTRHQIDAVGLFSTRIPFLYPLVLLAEAKSWRSRSVGVPVVRNLLGVLIDLRQTLPNVLSLPLNWPNDFYNENITVNYHGAVFSNGRFTWTANRYALSHGLYLVPVPISSVWLNKLSKKIKTLYRDQDKRSDYITNITNSGAVLDKLSKLPYRDLTDEEREIFSQIIKSIIDNCPHFKELNEKIENIHLASIDGKPLFIEIPPNTLIDLYKLALFVEYKKLESMGDRAFTGFETWYEAEFGLRCTIHITQTWPIAYQETISEEDDDWMPIHEARVSINNIKDNFNAIFSQEIVNEIAVKEETTLSVLLSRGLICQIKIDKIHKKTK